MWKITKMFSVSPVLRRNYDSALHLDKGVFWYNCTVLAENIWKKNPGQCGHEFPNCRGEIFWSARLFLTQHWNIWQPGEDSRALLLRSCWKPTREYLGNNNGRSNKNKLINNLFMWSYWKANLCKRILLALFDEVTSEADKDHREIVPILRKYK